MQPYKYYGGIPPHRGVETSVEAALAVMPKTIKQRDKVFHLLVAAGADGATDDELARWAKLPRSSICGRRNELYHDGLVRDSGSRRQTRYGQSAKVWVAVYPEQLTLDTKGEQWAE